MPTPDISDYKDLFLRTANDHVDGLQKLALQLASNGSTPKIIEEIYRHAHSLKGSSSVMGYKEIADLCTQIDTIIHPETNQSPKRKDADTIIECISQIKSILDEAVAHDK